MHGQVLIVQGYTSSFMGAWAGADRPGLHVEFCRYIDSCWCHWPSRATRGVLWVQRQLPVPLAFQGYTLSFVGAWAGAGAAGLHRLCGSGGVRRHPAEAWYEVRGPGAPLLLLLQV